MGNQLYGHVHVIYLIYLPSSEHIKIIIKSIINFYYSQSILTWIINITILRRIFMSKLN